MAKRPCGSYPHERRLGVKGSDMNKVTERQVREIRELAKVADDEIDTSDVPEVNDFTGAVQGRFYRPIKQRVTLGLDADLLAWLRSLGGKYQTRVNAALREYMDSHQKAR